MILSKTIAETHNHSQEKKNEHIGIFDVFVVPLGCGIVDMQKTRPETMETDTGVINGKARSVSCLRFRVKEVREGRTGEHDDRRAQRHCEGPGMGIAGKGQTFVVVVDQISHVENADQMAPDIHCFVVFMKERLEIVGPRLIDCPVTSKNVRFDDERGNIVACQGISRHLLQGEKGGTRTKMKALKAKTDEMFERRGETGKVIGEISRVEHVWTWFYNKSKKKHYQSVGKRRSVLFAWQQLLFMISLLPFSRRKCEKEIKDQWQQRTTDHSRNSV